MADQSESESSTGTAIASWVSPKFAREIRELATRDRRTVSSLIRIALEDYRLSASPTAKAAQPAGAAAPPKAPPGGGSEGEQ